MKKFIPYLFFVAAFILTSAAFALPLALNTATSILPDGTKITVAADLTINHDFPEFRIQKGQIFASEYGMDQTIPSCKVSFTENHHEGDCAMGANEVLTVMGPSVVKAGPYSTSCGKADPSMRSISFVVSLGSGRTLRFNCFADTIDTSRVHITKQNIFDSLNNQAISFH